MREKIKILNIKTSVLDPAISSVSPYGQIGELLQRRTNHTDKIRSASAAARFYNDHHCHQTILTRM